jgi:hypothetical protein
MDEEEKNNEMMENLKAKLEKTLESLITEDER